MEHWLRQPEVLKEYARHYETLEPVPQLLLDKMNAAKSFNQGFATIEYTACALLDMLLHQVEDYDDDFDVSKFEREQLDRLGMPQGIVMRHRPSHFSHLFASNMYASGIMVCTFFVWLCLKSNPLVRPIQRFLFTHPCTIFVTPGAFVSFFF
jgi:peptidyl-dipeptidase Dcp